MSQALRKTVWQFLNGKKQLQITYVINNLYPEYGGFPGGSLVKNPPANAGNVRRPGFDPWVRKIPWRRAWQPTPAFLPGESHGQRSVAGYSPWGCKESDMTEVT